jgi:hypothetical protein
VYIDGHGPWQMLQEHVLKLPVLLPQHQTWLRVW